MILTAAPSVVAPTTSSVVDKVVAPATDNVLAKFDTPDIERDAAARLVVKVILAVVRLVINKLLRVEFVAYKLLVEIFIAVICIRLLSPLTLIVPVEIFISFTFIVEIFVVVRDPVTYKSPDKYKFELDIFTLIKLPVILRLPVLISFVLSEARFPIET